MAVKQTEKLVKIRDSALFASRSLGYEKLKGLQLEVIKSFVGGKDVFAILPTGYGKSLCYACLPILLDHLHEQQHAAIVIVVAPLTAIMEEQVRPSITIAKVKTEQCNNYSGCQFIISGACCGSSKQQHPRHSQGRNLCWELPARLLYSREAA